MFSVIFGIVDITYEIIHREMLGQRNYIILLKIFESLHFTGVDDGFLKE